MIESLQEQCEHVVVLLLHRVFDPSIWVHVILISPGCAWRTAADLYERLHQWRVEEATTGSQLLGNEIRLLGASEIRRIAMPRVQRGCQWEQRVECRVVLRIRREGVGRACRIAAASLLLRLLCQIYQ